MRAFCDARICAGGIPRQGKKAGGFLTGKSARRLVRALAVRNDGRRQGNFLRKRKQLEPAQAVSKRALYKRSLFLPPCVKGVSRALCASPRCGVRAWRTEVFAIVGKNRDRWRRRSLRRREIKGGIVKGLPKKICAAKIFWEEGAAGVKENSPGLPELF